MPTGITNNDLKKKIFFLSFKYHLSHLGSCITSVDLIDAVYKVKRKSEPFVLSNGHAGVSLYCIIEKNGGRNAEEIFNHHGVHPDRCSLCGIDCSTGSLGQGLPIAVGMALADKEKNTYCLVSDGEMMEGSIWEVLRIVDELKLTNLKLLINANGWGAYREIDANDIIIKLRAFGWGVIKNEDNDLLVDDLKSMNLDIPMALVCITNPQFVFLQGQQGHYVKMDDEIYKEVMEALEE